MREEKSVWSRSFCLACLVVTLIAVMLAASRGGFLGLLAAALFIVWRSPHRIRNFVVIAACLAPLTLIVPRLTRPPSSASGLLG